MTENKNINAFKKLIERYENITLDEITDKWDDVSDLLDDYIMGEAVAGILTGYSKSSKCILCVEACDFSDNPITRKGILTDDHKCRFCIVNISDKETYGCTDPLFEGDKSFNNIGDAETPEQLFKAYKERAYALREFYKLNYGESL